MTHDECLQTVRNNGWALGVIPEGLRTHEICLEAVKQRGTIDTETPAA